VHTSTPPLVPAAPVLTGLGQALRWLRERQARKQYRVADDAGVTKGMLSAYETGRQRPSLETLDKLLETLGCDLNDLHNALQIVNGRPERMKGWQLRDANAGADAQGLSDLRQARPGLNERAAGQPLAGRGILEPARAASRQGPAYAAMPGFGILAQPGGTRSAMPLAGEVREAGRGRLTSELHRLLGLAGDEQSAVTSPPTLPQLPEEEELALAQMLEGFHSLLRYWHRCLVALSPRDPREAHEPPTAAEPLGHPGGTSAPAGPTAGADEGGGLGKHGSRGKGH
jgi:transcriptional regulator with XRE-family HTH domain